MFYRPFRSRHTFSFTPTFIRNSVKQFFQYFFQVVICVLLFLQRQNGLFVFWEWGVTDLEPETGLVKLWRLLSDSSKGAGRWMCVDFQYSGNTLLVLISKEQIQVSVCILHLYSNYMYGRRLGPKRRGKKDIWQFFGRIPGNQFCFSNVQEKKFIHFFHNLYCVMLLFLNLDANETIFDLKIPLTICKVTKVKLKLLTECN